MGQAYIRGDLLFHSIHGLCRVKEIIPEKQMDRKALYYALVPEAAPINRMSERFLIPIENLEASGFHPLVTPHQANDVLDYLKGQSRIEGKGCVIWELANEILTFCQEEPPQKNAKTRQSLERSVRGLIGELAIVFEISLVEAAAKVRKNLERSFTLSSALLVALSHAADA